MLAGTHKLKATLTLTLRDASGNRRALKKTAHRQAPVAITVAARSAR